MIQGLNIGPAIILNFLMRWPILIPLGTVSGVGIMLYEHYNINPIQIINKIYEKEKPKSVDTISKNNLIIVSQNNDVTWTKR